MRNLKNNVCVCLSLFLSHKLFLRLGTYSRSIPLSVSAHGNGLGTVQYSSSQAHNDPHYRYDTTPTTDILSTVVRLSHPNRSSQRVSCFFFDGRDAQWSCNRRIQHRRQAYGQVKQGTPQTHKQDAMQRNAT